LLEQKSYESKMKIRSFEKFFPVHQSTRRHIPQPLIGTFTTLLTPNVTESDFGILAEKCIKEDPCFAAHSGPM
jgi:hypothetical protein